MADFKIDARQLKRLDTELGKVGVDFRKGTKSLLKKIGVVVLGLARKYSPESPRKSDYARMNKSGRTKRTASSITSGSLRDSIRSDQGKDYVSINVPANSRGGAYAEKIHDNKGKSGRNGWKERGPRTKEKGRKADEKFIYRAAEDSEGKVDELIDKVIKELTGF